MKKQILLLAIMFIASTIVNAQWSQIGSDIDGEAADDKSGYSVSLSSDGNTVAIGAYKNDDNGTDAGHARIYRYSAGTWTQLGSDIDGEAAYDYSGYSISISSDGNTVAIGACYNDGGGASSGHVRIYHYNGTAWTQVGVDIDGEAGGDQSGYSVSLSSDGSIVAIGAFQNAGNGSFAGHARIYQDSAGNWIQVGSDIDGERFGDQFGRSISLSSDGSIVAIGSRLNDDNGSESGHVRVYQYSVGSWTKMGSDIDGEAANDWSGWSLSLNSDGNTVAIGATRNDGNGSNSGHVRVYHYSAGTWTKIGSDIDGEIGGDQSGYSVSLSSDGNTVAIGATENDANGASSGHVRVYYYNGINWAQMGIDIDGEALFDRSGYSVGLSSDGNTVAIGAPGNSSNGTGSGHARIYSFCGSTSNITETTCDSYTSPSTNYTWTSSGIYLDTLTNAMGCDSVITINLTINSNTGDTTAIACDSITWYGVTYYSSAMPTHTFTNVAGCDSVVTLDLTVNYSSTIIDTQTVCDSLIWIDGNTYYISNNIATYTLTNVAGCDSVIALDLTVNHSNTGTDVQSACFSYLWIDGNTYTANNNTATYTINNAAGCDSLVTLDLTINTVDVSVGIYIMLNGIGLTATLSGANYQWIDCNNSYLPISGETNQSFMPSVNGDYAVIIDDGVCIDTSLCYNINGVGIGENGNTSSIHIYPNPTNGIIIIEGEEMQRVEVLDVNGKTIYETAIATTQSSFNTLSIDLSIYNKGIYLINVRTESGFFVRKVVLE